jgi:hypothetical protein
MRISPNKNTLVSFTYLVKNRLWQVEETLSENIRYLSGRGAELVILDWGSGDGLRDWIKRNHQSEIEAGLLRYYSLASDIPFHINIGKNFAHRLARGRVLFNLDADNFAEGTFETLNNLSLGWGVRCPGFFEGTYGRIGMSAAEFQLLGGYDESFHMAGYGDIDLVKRAETVGMKFIDLPAAREAIPNGKSDTARFAPAGWTWEAMERENRLRSEVNLENGVVRANLPGWTEAWVEDFHGNLYHLPRNRFNAVPAEAGVPAGTTAKRLLHLGCGPLRIPGWENHDRSMVDIRLPLAFPTESVDAIFLEHVIEHVHPGEAHGFFREAHRILKDGGILRLAFPDPVRLAREFSEGYSTYQKQRNFNDGSLAGGIASIIGGHAHLGVWTAELMETVLETLGFETTQCEIGESSTTWLRGLERHFHNKPEWAEISLSLASTRAQTTVVEACKGARLPAEGKDVDGGRHVGHAAERFLILAREANPTTERLHEIFSAMGKTEVVADSPGRGAVWYPDEELAGYAGLMSDSSLFPPLTAWSRALYHLERTLLDHEAVWFIEDDVAGNPCSFRELVRLTAAADPDLAALDVHSPYSDPGWPHWHYATDLFANPMACFKPLSRTSAGLIRHALRFRREHGQFTFHEALFPSLAAEHGMNTLDWNKDEPFRRLFPSFRYRPVVEETQPGICHPVKDPTLHEAICKNAGTVVPR